MDMCAPSALVFTAAAAPPASAPELPSLQTVGLVPLPHALIINHFFGLCCGGTLSLLDGMLTAGFAVTRVTLCEISPVRRRWAADRLRMLSAEYPTQLHEDAFQEAFSCTPQDVILITEDVLAAMPPVTLVAAGPCWEFLFSQSAAQSSGATFYFGPSTSTMTLPCGADVNVELLGNHQRPGIDFDSTKLYAPVVSFVSIRILLALAVYLRRRIYNMDVTTAFLNAKFTEEIYIKLPRGMEEFSESGEPMVGRLLRALYGLRQSPGLWFTELDNYLKRNNFRQCTSDGCVYVQLVGTDGDFAAVAIYVDDIIILEAADPAWYPAFKTRLLAEFDCTDAGLCTWLMGMGLDWDDDDGRVPGLFPLSTDLTNEYLKQYDRRLPAQEEYLWMSCFGAHMAALFVALDELLQPYVPTTNQDFTPYLARARNHAEAIDKAFRFRLAFLRRLNEIKRLHARKRPLLLEWRLQLHVAGVGEDVAVDAGVAAKDTFGSDELGQRTLDLLSSSLSAQTLKSYAGRLSQFAEFCHDSENISPLEATTATVVRYVAWIGERGLIGAKSLQPYLSAINTFFELHNLDPIAKDSLHLTSARRGLMLRQRRLDAAPLRVPLPADVAYRFVTKAELIVSAPYPEYHHNFRALLASVVNFMFFARGLTGVSCRVRDVHVDDYNITLQVYREKSRAGRRGPEDLRVRLLPVS
eukprot:jgi/Tetstr1/439601/TSEL_028025.t1